MARALVDHVFLKWGLCFTILTDQGLEFEPELLKELCNILGVAHVRTSAYHPQGNGACEVWHRTINTMLAKVISTGQRDWSEWVPYITFCNNATVHSTTGFSQFFVFTGRQPLWTVDLFVPEAEGPGKTVPVYTAETIDRLNRAMHLVREHLQASARREVLVVGTTAEPGPGSLPRGTLFVYIVPANSLAVHQNGCRSMPLKARSSVS